MNIIKNTHRINKIYMYNQDSLDIDTIIKKIQTYTKKHDYPLISRNKWKIIRKTPFTVLISCILSLRTKDEVTEKASIRLLKTHDTPQKILTLSEKTIENLIYPVGFYHVKAKRIRNISQTLIDNYHGNVPMNFKELLSIKGVGRKTANIVMVYGHQNSNYLPIDTHCHRIPNRLGWINTKTPEETEKALKRLLPQKYWKEFNHLFVIFGQNMCTPVSPYCSKCPVNDYCQQVNVSNHR